MPLSFISLNTLVVLVAGLSASDFTPGAPMVISAGNDVGWQVSSPAEARTAFQERGELRIGPEKLQAHWEQHGPRYMEHGITAFEPYVKWMLLEPEEGTWDPAYYDAAVSAFKEHGLKWVPFLIAGPAYATPPWFKESDESVFAVDLVTGDVTRDQSIWNPHLRPRIRAWLTRFFEHYRHDDMQAVLLGISGVFGESIYTARGNEWTQIWDGEYPQHQGWWCGDDYAKADFQKTMREKYGDIAALNQAWNSKHESFAEVTPFVPDQEHTSRARLDLVRWYTASMTDYAEWWIETTRALAPKVPILLCTGGGANPELGADMTAQTRMAARHGAGIRITNEASNYEQNFFLTRIIATASHHYDTYFGYEPAGAVDTNGIVARIYNAVASGAWELFIYDNPPDAERGAQYKRYLDLMKIRQPEVEVGFFWSRTSADLKLQRGLERSAREVRDLCDVAYLDEQLIADGALDDLKVFVWTSGTVTERETTEALRKAVERGVTLIVPEGWNPSTPEGDALFPTEFARTPGVAPLGEGFILTGTGARADAAISMLATLLQEPASLGVPGLSPEASLDGQEDDLYLSVTTQDILLFNHGDVTKNLTVLDQAIEVPAHTIIAVER